MLCIQERIYWLIALKYNGTEAFRFQSQGRVWDESLTATNIQQLTHQSQVKLKKRWKKGTKQLYFLIR
jgi:hypothetical protein